MSTESLAETPVTSDALLASNAADAPPLFDERALLAHYVLRDFEQAVANVEQELREAEPSAATEEDLAAMAHERRDLARQIVTGAWLNRNNPAWDPLDPETHRSDPNDPLLAILQSIQDPAD